VIHFDMSFLLSFCFGQMITILTGTPGAGKTSWLISYLIEEIKKGRRVYVDNVPDLVLDVRKAGKVDEWQKGTWLGIDTFSPTDGDPDSAWAENGNGKPDAGALVVVDECQRWFRPRGGRSVPEHIAALEVHRHQGLDFLFITQNLKLVDSNVTVLCSKHIHIRLTPFGRKIYEWPEVANPNSKQQRDAAATKSYKPDPKVFSLYKSASVHTKLKHKLPNAAAMVTLCLVGFSILSYFAYDKIFKKAFADAPVVADASAVSHTVRPGVRVSPAQPVQPVRPAPVAPSTVATEERTDSPQTEPAVAGCFASAKSCVCHAPDGSKVDYSVSQCLAYLDLDSLPSPVGAVGMDVFPHKTVQDRFFAGRALEWHRLHPNRPMPQTREYVAGLWNKYVDSRR